MAQFFESYNRLLTTGLPNGYKGYMSRSADGVAMDLTLVRSWHAAQDSGYLDSLPSSRGGQRLSTLEGVGRRKGHVDA